MPVWPCSHQSRSSIFGGFSMGGVSLQWNGLDKVIGKAGQRLKSHRAAMLHDVGETLVANTKLRFMDGLDPEGKKWEPSARAWLDGVDDGRFGKTLVDSGELKKSIDHMTTDDGVLIGSNKKYARIHQLGGKAGRGRKVTIPARPYLGFNDADREDVEDILQEYMANCFKG